MILLIWNIENYSLKYRMWSMNLQITYRAMLRTYRLEKLRKCMDSVYLHINVLCSSQTCFFRLSTYALENPFDHTFDFLRSQIPFEVILSLIIRLEKIWVRTEPTCTSETWEMRLFSRFHPPTNRSCLFWFQSNSEDTPLIQYFHLIRNGTYNSVTQTVCRNYFSKWVSLK